MTAMKWPCDRIARKTASAPGGIACATTTLHQARVAKKPAEPSSRARASGGSASADGNVRIEKSAQFVPGIPDPFVNRVVAGLPSRGARQKVAENGTEGIVKGHWRGSDR